MVNVNMWSKSGIAIVRSEATYTHAIAIFVIAPACQDPNWTGLIGPSGPIATVSFLFRSGFYLFLKLIKSYIRVFYLVLTMIVI